MSTILHLTDERDTLKMLRETLCEAQVMLGFIDGWPDSEARFAEVIPHRERIERIIDEIDRQRPLDPDGTHGDLHTASCGCELDDLDEEPETITTEDAPTFAEEPIESRLLRAFMNGFREGAERAAFGERWDR